MPVIVSERLLKYPVRSVYKAFSDPDRLSKWWGPHGFTNRFEVFDLRPGGHWIFDMIDENGKAYPNHGVFQEVIPEELITWTRLSQPIFDMKVTFIPVDDSHCRISFHMIIPEEKLYQTFLSFAPQKNEENFERLESDLGDQS
jgi:uncharacterized protein YndB with AHSA1/START domain